LITRPNFTDRNALDVFVRRIQGVIVARNYVLVDYDIQNSLVEQACKITPGIESPTVSALHNSQWSAVRAMVPRKQVHAIMDELYDLGARGVIVTDIHACRI
jgi:ATP phosphoribosyltransferase